MRHTLITVVVGVALGWSVASALAGPGPAVTATVTTLSATSRLVHIVNHDRVPYGYFIIQSIDNPRIATASKPCSVERDLNFVGTKTNWRYRAKCRSSVAPGGTLDIRLTTSGRGRIVVYVVLKGALSLISR